MAQKDALFSYLKFIMISIASPDAPCGSARGSISPASTVRFCVIAAGPMRSPAISGAISHLRKKNGFLFVEKAMKWFVQTGSGQA